jgi:hypothetical protein
MAGLLVICLEKVSDMKNLIGIVILSLLLGAGSYGQHTELRFGANGINGIPGLAGIGDTVQLSFHLKNTGTVDFQDTIRFWVGTRDSSGMGLAQLQEFAMVIAAIDQNDSLAMNIPLPLDASMFVPGVNITVVWPLLDQDDPYTTEVESFDLQIDPNSFNIAEIPHKSLRVYPNPGDGIFTLDGPFDWTQEWVVYAASMDGRIHVVRRDHDQLFMEEFSAGAYLIWLRHKNETYSYRLVLE